MKSNKKFYIAPDATIVKLDNEISLALESAPPAGPDEGYIAPEHFNNDPLKAC